MNFTPEGKKKLLDAWHDILEQQNRIFTWTYSIETDDDGNSSICEELQIDLERISAIRWKPSTLPGMDAHCEIYTDDNFEAFVAVDCLEGEKDDLQEAYTNYGMVR
jgi:hypothetical protein